MVRETACGARSENCRRLAEGHACHRSGADADKYNSKSIPPKFLTAQAYAKRAERYGEANKRRWLDLVDQYGVPDVPALAARFRMRMI